MPPQFYDENGGTISELHHTNHFKILTEALRADHPGVPVILVQAGWDEYIQKDNRNAGMYALTARFVGLSEV